MCRNTGRYKHCRAERDGIQINGCAAKYAVTILEDS